MQNCSADEVVFLSGRLGTSTCLENSVNKVRVVLYIQRPAGVFGCYNILLLNRGTRLNAMKMFCICSL